MSTETVAKVNVCVSSPYPILTWTPYLLCSLGKNKYDKKKYNGSLIFGSVYRFKCSVSLASWNLTTPAGPMTHCLQLNQDNNIIFMTRFRDY